MATDTFNVEVQQDLVEKLSRAKPVHALSEMIWNALDADATEVSAHVEYDSLGSMSAIVVEDNGVGMSREDATEYFQRLGGSWKKPGGRTKQHNRALHGNEGRGRFKAFALGRTADWVVTYDVGGGDLKTYTITILEQNIREVRISDEADAAAGASGVKVRIADLRRDFTSLDSEEAAQDFAEVFALYLKDYRNVQIKLNGATIDPEAAVLETKSFPMSDITYEDEVYPSELEVIEWRGQTKRALYLANENGMPFSQVETKFHVGDFQFSAYLKSSLMTKLHGDALLGVEEMDPAVDVAITEARERIKEHFRKRAAQRARFIVDEWKRDKVYPYEGEAASPLETAERQVFDIVAVTASNYMRDFETVATTTKALHLRLLRSAIEESPAELQTILTHVLKLPARKQKDLADLLQETSLSAIITAAKTVGDRLKFLQALENIVFDRDMRKRLKERAQLHKIVEDNVWLFGETFNISVSDKGLTAVLKKHKELIGDDTVIGDPVRHVSQDKGIVDLMLSRTIRNHRANEVEHLVVELKAPSVKVGSKEIGQVEGYAFSIAEDERFANTETRWSFWVISNDMDAHAARRANAANMPRGMIHQDADRAITI